MSDFDLPLFFNMSKQLLASAGLNAECVQVSCKPGASRELDLRPQGLRSSKCSKLIFGYIIVVIGTNLIFVCSLINLKFEGLYLSSENDR